MKSVFQFSLQGCKQKSLDFFLLLLNMFPTLYSDNSFHNSDLIIPFMIDLGRNLEKNWPVLGQNFIFCFRPGRAWAEIFIFTSGRAKIATMRAGPARAWKIRLVQTSTIDTNKTDFFYVVL